MPSAPFGIDWVNEGSGATATQSPIPTYSALGIDWTKRISGMPSGRDFVYVDPAAGTRVIGFREVSELYG